LARSLCTLGVGVEVRNWILTLLWRSLGLTIEEGLKLEWRENLGLLGLKFLPMRFDARAAIEEAVAFTLARG